MGDPRGSVWRQWDLHFHTPSSYDYKDKSISDEDIVRQLKDANISVLAITDHHVMDVERIRHIQELAYSDITVLPGIELRSELGGKESVHFIGIFPEDCNLEDLWQEIYVKLEISPGRVAKIGHDRVYVELKKGAELFHELGGLVSVHAGNKSNSIDNIANTEAFKQEFKKDLVNNHIDILEVGVPSVEHVTHGSHRHQDRSEDEGDRD